MRHGIEGTGEGGDAWGAAEPIGGAGLTLLAGTGVLLWLVHYGLFLAHGLATGGSLFDAVDSPLLRLDAVAFFGVLASLGAALVVVGRRARSPHRTASWLARASMGAGAAGIAPALAPLVPPARERVLSVLGPLGILTLFVASILWGLRLRRSAPTRALGGALLLFGAGLLPLGLLLQPLEATMPPYLVSEAHFTAAAGLWGWIAWRSRPDRWGRAGSASRGAAGGRDVRAPLSR